MAAEICSAQAVYVNLGDVFADSVHFLFLRIREYQLCNIMYKVNSNEVPDYLVDLFTKTSSSHGYETRQAEFNFVPRNQIRTFVKNHSHVEVLWLGINYRTI